MKKITNKLLIVLILAFLNVTIISCSKDEVIEEMVEVEDPIEDPVEDPAEDPNVIDLTGIDANKIATINTGSTEGLAYNFWSTRPMINQNRFNASGFRNSLTPLKSYVKSYNLVRTMGGRTDN